MATCMPARGGAMLREVMPQGAMPQGAMPQGIRPEEAGTGAPASTLGSDWAALAATPQDEEPLYEPSEDEVEAVLAEFDGDPKRAIRGLLQDIAILAEDRRRNLSYGYMYGHLELVKLP
jgi:hypothetical protein